MIRCYATLRIPPRCIWKLWIIPGEWLLDLPMLAQDYLSWSRQMTGLLNGQRGEWSAKWRMMSEGLDPLAPADEKPAGGHCRRVDRLSPPL